MIKRKKTVLLVDTMSFGGSERTVQILANNQEYIENQLIIVSLANLLQYDLKDNVIRKTIYKKNYSAIIKLLILPLTILKLLIVMKKIKAESIISFHQQSHLLNIIISKILKCKSIISERAYIELYYGKKNRILKPIISFLYNKSNLICVNDIEIKKSLIKFYKIKKTIVVINNLLDVANFTKTEKRKSKYINFITIGRLSNEKNTKDIIYAFKKANIQNSKLKIIGDGPLLERLKLLVENLDLVQDVHFLGHQSNVGAFLNNADIFVFSSLNEGFPNVVLEAMFYELPIISYKFKAGISSILDDGKYGILVPLKNIDELSEKMKYLALNEKARSNYKKLSAIRVKNYTNKRDYISKYGLILD